MPRVPAALGKRSDLGPAGRLLAAPPVEGKRTPSSTPAGRRVNLRYTCPPLHGPRGAFCLLPRAWRVSSLTHLTEACSAVGRVAFHPPSGPTCMVLLTSLGGSWTVPSGQC